MAKRRFIIVPFGCLVPGGVFRWNKRMLERCREPKRWNCARELLQPFTVYPLEEEQLVVTNFSQLDEGTEKFIVEEIFVNTLPKEKPKGTKFYRLS